MKTIAIAAGALLLAQGVFAGEVSAQVLEIGDDGVVTTYSGPMVFTNAGAQTLVKASVPVPSLDPARAEVPRLVAEAAARQISLPIRRSRATLRRTPDKPPEPLTQ